MAFLSDEQLDHEQKKQRKQTKKMSLLDIIFCIFQKHAKGIEFKEWNSPHIDQNMFDHGFNIYLSVDWNNGFIFGGNKSNCLTWMDKMGSSERAKNKGKPATPRNGAPIELVGLLYHGLKLMSSLYL